MLSVGFCMPACAVGTAHGFYKGEPVVDFDRIAAINERTKTPMALHGGTGLKMSDWIDQVPAALHAFYPGQNGGQALAEILLGKVNPSAKLPISIERNIEDNPIYATFPKFDNQETLAEMSYKDDLFLGYRGYEKKGIKPLYPFGYGLSYTTFGYSNISVTPGVAVAGAPIKVSFDLANTGKVAGAEVAELYVGQNNPKVERAIKELKGYKKVFLKPGESKRVTIELNDRSLAYYDVASKQWVVDADSFNLSVGASSQDIRLNAKLVNPWTVQIALNDGTQQTLTARSIVIAAGARPFVPPLPGLALQPQAYHPPLAGQTPPGPALRPAAPATSPAAPTRRSCSSPPWRRSGRHSGPSPVARPVPPPPVPSLPAATHCRGRLGPGLRTVPSWALKPPARQSLRFSTAHKLQPPG